MNPYFRQAARVHGIWPGTLSKLMKSESSEYIGRGMKLKMFTPQEDKRMKKILLEKNNGSYTVDMSLVKQIVDQEIELIKINEPHRKFDMKYYHLTNFVNRHNFKLKKKPDIVRLFECDVCFKKFSLKSSLRTHKKTIHYSFLK